MRTVSLLILAVATVSCAGASKEQLAAKENEAATCQKGLEEANGKVTATTNKAKALEQQLATLQARTGDLEKRLASTSNAKAELEMTTAKLTEQSQELQGKMVIKLNERLQFAENSTKLTPEAKKFLDAMADAVAQLKGKTVVVAGYTDDAEAAGKDAAVKRWQLSTNRGLEVAKYLVGRGLDPTLVAVAGFGASKPIAPNDSLANKALNRRVEVALTPANIEHETIEVKPATLKNP